MQRRCTCCVSGFRSLLSCCTATRTGRSIFLQPVLLTSCSGKVDPERQMIKQSSKAATHMFGLWRERLAALLFTRQYVVLCICLGEQFLNMPQGGATDLVCSGSQRANNKLLVYSSRHRPKSSPDPSRTGSSRQISLFCDGQLLHTFLPKSVPPLHRPLIYRLRQIEGHRPAFFVGLYQKRWYFNIGCCSPSFSIVGPDSSASGYVFVRRGRGITYSS